MSKEKIVRQMGDIEDAVGGMRAAMQSTPESVATQEMEITNFKKKYPDAIYLKPKYRVPTKGKTHPEKEKDREHMHEYVVGIFESQIVGQMLSFWKDGLPGDDFCMWEIPVNKPIGIPRHVAKHLSNNLKWKEMKPLGRDNPPEAFYEENMITPFTKFEEKRRGAFHPINAY